MRDQVLKLRAESGGIRLDKFLAGSLEGMSRSAIQGLIAQGLVTSGEKPLAKSAVLAAGQLVQVVLPEPKELELVPENIPLDVAYEDGDLLVVNKPKGMVVHPAPGSRSGTLVNALLHHCGESLSGINGVLRPGIVHRIDKDTSGLLLVAKNNMAHQSLAAQIQAHTLTREYRAVAYGGFSEDAGTIDAPIGRHPVDRKRMAVLKEAPAARQAVTHYFVEERLRDFTYLRLRLETGRTHQIRVHLAYLGRPVAGDPVYGPKKVLTELHGQCLHAGLLGFCHPRTGEYMEFSQDLPAYFQKFLQKLRREAF
ncbi:RluA family pseudouridine synthase [Oscillospiraceae bacterium 42-9]